MIAINRVLVALFFYPKYAAIRRLQFILAIGIFAYFALSGQPPTIAAITSDKLLHFMGNFLLMGSTWTAFFGRIRHGITIFFAVTYSMSIEILQGFTQMRQPDMYDALTNLAGLLVGYGLCLLIEKYLQNARMHTTANDD